MSPVESSPGIIKAQGLFRHYGHVIAVDNVSSGKVMPNGILSNSRLFKGKYMDTEHDIVVIFCTIPAIESEAMACALVDSRLVACVNVVPVQSYFRWNGEFCTEPEHLLIAKTKRSMAEATIAAIKSLHSYDLPEIIAVPIVYGYAPYLAWVHAETKDEV